MCACKIGSQYDTCEGVHVSWLNIACDTQGLCVSHATRIYLVAGLYRTFSLQDWMKTSLQESSTMAVTVLISGGSRRVSVVSTETPFQNSFR